jgi:hypothetical protein
MRTTMMLLPLLVAGLCGPGMAMAQDATTGLDDSGTPAAAPAAELPPETVSGDGKRPIPDYDGRTPAPRTAGQTLVWVPRAVLFPVQVVAEYGVRRPFVGFVTWGEEHYIGPRLYRVFTSEDGKRGVYPYFLVDTGMRPRLGAVSFVDGFLHPANDLRLSASLAKTDVYAVTMKDRAQLDGRNALVMRAGYSAADDNRFYGLGPLSAVGNPSSFATRRFDGSATLEHALGKLSKASLFVGFRDARFGSSRWDGSDRDLATTHGGEGQPALPPGWDGYQLIGTGAKLVLDSRSADFDANGATGVRFETDGVYSMSPGAGDLRFGEWGGELAGFLDVSGHDNVFGARVATRFQENAGDTPVPFTERLSLGGAETMRGFLPGRMRGDSSFLVELQYRYAIWTFADAELFSSVGNTFEGHLDGLRPGALFWSSGLSLRTTFSRDSSWAVGVALGSRRFDDKDFTAADHVRLFAGLNQGF